MAQQNTSRDFDLADLVKKAEGDNFNKKPVAYEFSNGKKFLSPGEFGGVYAPEEVAP